MNTMNNGVSEYNTKRAVVYARVSTSEQTKGFSLASQIKGCKRYAKANNLNVILDIKEDISGATRLEERPHGNELLKMARAGEVDSIVVWRLDRLSRPPEGEYSRLLTTIEQFAQLGVTIHDCESGEVSSSMNSILIAFFKGLAASKEREAIRERSMRGKYEKAQSGRWGWGGVPPYGWDKVGKGKDAYLVINEEEAAVIRRIFNLFIGKDGKPMSLFAIAKLLTLEGVPTPGSKRKNAGKHWQYNHIGRRILQSRRYLGEFRYRDVDLYFPELAIIDEETWQAAQDQLELHSIRPRRKTTGIVYLLAGRFRCKCGSLISGSFSHVKTKKGINTHKYYRCSNKTNYGNISCSQQNLKVGDIDELVWKWIQEIIGKEGELEKTLRKMIEQAEKELEPTKEELIAAEKLLKQTDGKIGKLMSAFGDEDDETILESLHREIKQIAELKKSLERQKAGLETKIATARITPSVENQIKAQASELRHRIENGGTAENRQYVIEMLNVQAKLIEKSDGSYLGITCGLGDESKLIRINDHSPA